VDPGRMSADPFSNGVRDLQCNCTLVTRELLSPHLFLRESNG